MKQIKFLKGVAVACVMIVLFACSAQNGTALTVTILHVNDNHSHIEPNSIDLELGGEKTRTKIGGYPQMISFLKESTNSAVNPILINAGDMITGTIYYTLFEGEVEARILNLIPWDVLILGNHEFDEGDDGLLKFLNNLQGPVVSANVVPKEGNILEGKWEPYKIIEREGQKIGIIGIDVVRKTKDSSNPSDEIIFLDEIETAQKYADLLTKQGINKIIVASHYGYANDLELAKQTTGIDVIVGGDSHTLLGPTNLVQGLTPEASYPTVLKSKSNETVLVVQSYEYAKVVGSLQVNFDEKGLIVNYEGNPTVLINDTFKRKNAEGKRVELEGDSRDAVYQSIEANEDLVLVGVDDEAQKIANEYKGKVEEAVKQVVGVAEEEIPGGSAVRIPTETNPQGHFTAALVAHAYLETLRSMGTGQVDVVIQNAGGVRTPILKGDITYGTAYELLPFANTLYTMDLTGEDIINTLEDAIEYALLPDGSSGAFPYTAGLKYDVDFSASKGNRISNVEIQKQGEWNNIDKNANYTVGVNSYIAGGKDGYLTLGKLNKEGKGLDTYLDYAKAFVDYVQVKKSIKKPKDTNVRVVKF